MGIVPDTQDWRGKKKGIHARLQGNILGSGKKGGKSEGGREMKERKEGREGGRGFGELPVSLRGALAWPSCPTCRGLCHQDGDS